MPAINSRMSASSSTMRMSRAMREGRIPVPVVGFADGAQLKYQPGRRAAAGPVVQDQVAAMVLHDFLDDGKPQAGPLRARRDIGLGQAVAVARRQAATVVLDADDDAPRLASHPQPDPAL